MSVETYWLVAPLTFMALSVPIWLYVWLVPVPPPARAAAPGHQAVRGNATMSDLYDADFRRWTERQSGLLRRMGAGDRVNDQVDWNHVAEEIESLGKSDRRQVINRVATIVEHLMRTRCLPGRPAALRLATNRHHPARPAQYPPRGQPQPAGRGSPGDRGQHRPGTHSDG